MFNGQKNMKRERGRGLPVRGRLFRRSVGIKFSPCVCDSDGKVPRKQGTENQEPGKFYARNHGDLDYDSEHVG